MSKKIGDNTPYPEEIKDEMLERLARGESLRSICRLDHMPVKKTVILDWRADEAWGIRYNQSREMQADSLADEVLDITKEAIEKLESGTAKNGYDRYVKLRMEALKWSAEHLMPNKYFRPDNSAPQKIEIKLDASQIDTKINTLSAEIDALKNDV